MQLHVGIIAEQ